MKKILFLALIFLLFCCKNRTNYFEGYICDYDKRPIENLSVFPENDSVNITFTDKNGFFRLKKENFLPTLIVKKETKIVAEIHTVRTHPEFGASFSFAEGQNDTLFIDMSKYEK